MTEIKKGVNKSQKPKITGAQMLEELNLPAYIHVPFIKCSNDCFSEGFSKLVEYYVQSASGTAKGEKAFAVRFLFARCINDLVTGFHLATHGYVIQSHSVLRSIFESLDKIELFSSRAKIANLWVNNPAEFRKKFPPAEIRKLVKKSGSIYEQMYWLFCEIGTHPSFLSSRTMSYMQKVDGEKPKIIVKIGPTDIVYPILFVLVFCFLFMMSVSLSVVKHLKTDGKIEKELLFFQFEKMAYFLDNCAKLTFIKYEGELPRKFQEILSISNKQKEYIEKFKAPHPS